MTVTDEQRRALDEFETASLRLKRLAGEGAQLSTRRGAEAKYGQTYQSLVRLGLKPQVRGRYR